MTALPWDRFPDEPEPAPPAAPPPPAPAPARRTDVVYRDSDITDRVDLAAALKDAFSQALREAGPQFKEQVTDYARGTAGAVLRGQQVDHQNPTVTAQDHTGRELVVADARNRSWRTFVQGLMFDVVAAIVVVIGTLSGADLMQRETWLAFGILLLKSVVSAAISYVMRLRVTPTIHTRGDEFALMPLPVPLPEEK